MQDKHNVADIIQMYYQAKARQIPVQSDANSFPIYPEYILPYLVHALAHNSCPNVEECKDVGAYDNIYRYNITHLRYLYAEFIFRHLEKNMKRLKLMKTINLE